MDRSAWRHIRFLGSTGWTAEPLATRQDLRMPRTDLAIDELLHQPEKPAAPGGHPPDGIEVSTEKVGAIEITRVKVVSEEGQRAIGKPQGHYITLSAAELPLRDTEIQEQAAHALARELAKLIQLGPDGEAFVVGLGNWNATPDALGPRVVEDILVTRHLHGQVPPDLVEGTRRVSALAPGVLGLTGIETGEIIRGIVEHVHPDVVIAVDSLASRSVARLLRTIQISDSGIHPGSGVGNRRAGINRESIGVPVIAIGVPTVVHASVIASDTLQLLAKHFEGQPEYRKLAELDDDARHKLVSDVLAPAVGDLVVTPKEIDVVIDDLAKVVAAGINAALHPKIGEQAIRA